MQSVLRSARPAIPLRSAHAHFAASTSAAAKPRRPSPYRLPSLPSFLASFAPLHAAGWRLECLGAESASSSSSPLTTHSAADDVLSGADLQGRRLVRAYAFPRDRAGWAALTSLMRGVGEAVEAEEHHPVITIGPVRDVAREIRQLGEKDEGYVLYLATHTHTPMPPLGAQFDGKPAPGVTGKDLKLAERVEQLYEDARTGEV